MSDKIERILDWYLNIMIILILVTLIGTLIVGPLILGLLISPYCFFMYLVSLLILPPASLIFIVFIREVKDGLSTGRIE